MDNIAQKRYFHDFQDLDQEGCGALALNQSLSPIPSSCDAMHAGNKGWWHGSVGEALPVK